MDQQTKNELTASFLNDHEKRLFKLEVVISMLLRDHPETAKKAEKMGFYLVPEKHD